MNAGSEMEKSYRTSEVSRQEYMIFEGFPTTPNLDTAFEFDVSEVGRASDVTGFRCDHCTRLVEYESIHPPPSVVMSQYAPKGAPAPAPSGSMV